MVDLATYAATCAVLADERLFAQLKLHLECDQYSNLAYLCSAVLAKSVDAWMPDQIHDRNVEIFALSAARASFHLL
nr:hypothetical protein CFP56_16920 [Quercus suber]